MRRKFSLPIAALILVCLLAISGCVMFEPAPSMQRIASARGASVPAASPSPSDTDDLFSEDPAEDTPLQLGSTDPVVKRLQQRLIDLGYLHRDMPSEYFDIETEGALKIFQKQVGLEVTGTATIGTLAQIFDANAPAHATPEPGTGDVPVPREQTSTKRGASEQSVQDALPLSTEAITTQPTQSGALSGVRIGIDPGHQAHGNSEPEPVAPGASQTKAKVTSGTSGVVTGVDEYVVNLQVALKLRDLLLGQGAEVVMTRETNDVDISNSERARMLNDAGVDLAIRLHCDGEDDSSRHGAFVLIPSGSYTTAIQSASREAGEDVLESFIQTTGAANLGLSERSDQTGFNWSTVPIINIEMGHMSNPDEDRKLASDEYQDLCALGIMGGISEYFS